ncbi:MAG: FMN-binding protein, partial [Nitrospirae bacterium]|nr:FMN-binding protein [Nitrospirota bacterium]
GLGDEIEKKDFKKQFGGKSLENIELVKVETKDKIQAISGATISSRAVTKGVKEAVKLLNEKYGKGLSKE